MTDRDTDVPRMVTIRNVTRSSLSFRVPGQSIRLMPGQAVEVHKAYLDTTELHALCRQGAVSHAGPEAPAQAAGDEGERDGTETGRRSGTRRR